MFEGFSIDLKWIQCIFNGTWTGFQLTLDGIQCIFNGCYIDYECLLKGFQWNWMNFECMLEGFSIEFGWISMHRGWTSNAFWKAFQWNLEGIAIDCGRNLN